MRNRLLILFAIALLLCGCDNRKRKPDSLKGRVTGSVLCADTGKPARFAYVTIVSMPSRNTTFDKDDPLAPESSTHTDITGRFTLEAIPPGSYFVVATLNGYQDPVHGLDFARLASKANDAERAADAIAQWQDYLAPVTVAAQRTSDVTVSLQRASEIDGTVSYDDGSPAIGSHFRLYRKTKNGTWSVIGDSPLGGWELPVVRDSHGRFSIPSLPAGEYRVCALLPTISEDNTLPICLGNVLRPRTSSSIKLSAGEQQSGLEIVVPLSGLHTLSGFVTVAADGHAPTTALVRLLYADDRKQVRQVSIDQDGSFAFQFVPEDNYIVRVTNAEDHEAPEGDNSESGNSKNSADSNTAQPPTPPPHPYADKEMPVQLQGDITDLSIQLAPAADAPKPQ